MVKNNLIFLFAFFLSWFGYANGQKDRLIFEDQFDNNKQNWIIQESPSHSSNVENGHYVITNEEEKGFEALTHKAEIDASESFSIETKIKQVKGTVNFGYGLIFGMRDTENFYVFEVTSNSYFSIYYYSKGEKRKLVEWTKTDALSTMGTYNDLRLAHESGMFNFYINNQRIASLRPRKFFGNRFGFKVMKHMSVWVDFIKVWQLDQDKTPKIGNNISIPNGVNYFNETFNDNRNRWTEFEDDEAYATIDNGEYMLKHKLASGYFFWSRYLFIEEFKDVYIETNIKQVAGDSKSAYGIVFGMKDAKNFYSFVISSNQVFRIFGQENGKQFTLKKWTAAEKVINPMSKNNRLTIRKKGDFLYFFINGKEVFSDYHRKFFGHRIGYQVSKNILCAVNDFKVVIPKVDINLIDNPIQGYVKENLGGGINSAYDELGPIISADGETLYLLRDEHPENISSEVSMPDNVGGAATKRVYNNDIWFAKMADGEWGDAASIGQPLNNEGHNFVISVSPDNNTLLLANEYRTDGSPGGDGVSIAYSDGDGWSNPESIDIVGDYNLNKYVSYFLSSNNRVLVMALEQEDSYGDLDLYVSFKKLDGAWTIPKNMGSSINSPGSESTAFLAPDNKTMYFSSSGWPGYGSNDIFMTKRLDDSWLRWSAPKNLGPEVNTSEWEGYYSISAEGDYAYLASYTNTLGMSDIFRIKIHDAAKPDAVMLVKGVVYDKKSLRPLKSSISVRKLDNDEVVALANSNPVTGAYEIVLPAGESYSFYAEGQGYYSMRENKDLNDLNGYEESSFDLYLVPIELGATIKLNNVFFIRSKNILKPNSYAELNELVRVLNTNPSLEIVIEGHTDNTGNERLNVELSEERAEIVMNYLIDQGIKKQRLSSKGYGGSKPIAENRLEATRKLNRRVEFRIVKY